MILNVFLYESHLETLLLKRMSILNTPILHTAENFIILRRVRMEGKIYGA